MTVMDILLAAIIILLGWWAIDWLSSYKSGHKQYCYIYCPKCGNEMIKNGNVVEDNDGIVKYKCSKCGCITFWDFTFPAPYLRTCGDCEHVSMDKFGTPYCEKENCWECSPDTQVKFEFRKEKSMINTNDLYHDDNEAITFIEEETGLNESVIKKVLGSEFRYMQSKGIIEEGINYD